MLIDKRNGFTMIELVFVIVVLGILAAIAIPRLAATRDDAQIAKGRSDVAAIRSAIVSERQGRLLTGDSTFIATLDGAAQNTAGVALFNNAGLLMYGITAGNGNGQWMKTGNTAYTFTVMTVPVTFNYTQDNGTFDCNRTAAGNAGPYCRLLVD